MRATTFIVLLLAIAATETSFCNGSSDVGCIETERQALLRFKRGLEDRSNRLASWISSDRDCCQWAGVVCDNFTGHILELHLRNPFNAIFSDAADPKSMLVGKISPSLLDFKYLIYLDLGGNNFSQEFEVPTFLGSLRNLRYLNLSQTGFEGRVPHEFGNLSNLQCLDLSQNGLEGPIPHGLQNLSALKYLDLSKNYLNSSIPNWLNKFSHLEYLSLHVTSLEGPIPKSFGGLCNLRFISLSNVNLSQDISEIIDIFSGCISNKLESLFLKDTQLFGHLNNQFGQYENLDFLSLGKNSISGLIPSSLGEVSSLRYLHLYSNEFNGSIPLSLGELSSLEVLDLSGNKLNGLIPSSFGEFSSIVKLDLSHNELNGSIPSSLGQLSSLEVLYLSYNKLNGPVPSSLGQLSSLQDLDFSWNKLNDTLYPSHFSNLTRLTRFDISQNSIVLKLNSDWVPPFQLYTLRLASCHLGPQFPFWINSLKNLYDLDLSNTGIVGTVPSWFWKFASQLTFLNLSHNQIHGEIPSSVKILNFGQTPYGSSIDLSSNNFSGSLPPMPSGINKLDLSGNALSGSISQFLCHVNESRRITVLCLRDNLLSGELPDCWMNYPSLVYLNLENNKFSGNLPVSLGTLTSIESLHLRKNSLSGTIPDSILNCTGLQVFDVAENEFVGHVPMWLGEGFPSMLILNLRSNKFHGPLPSQLCHITYLQILDIAYNNLSGTIPRCISNFSAMVKVDYSAGNNILHFLDYIGGVAEDEQLTLKGQGTEYDNTLNLVRIIDLSSNNFSGEIPTEVTNLKALQSLNLSHNFFVGRIPEKIGVMRSLESIDFSTNQLSGEIPQSISELTFLSHLNLSNNNLKGKIPLSTQIQSFDASCFDGNELCGSPLHQNCTEIVPTPGIENEGEKDGNEVNWFYVSMTLGFVMGFWSFIGPLLVNRRWRKAAACLMFGFQDLFSRSVSWVSRSVFIVSSRKAAVCLMFGFQDLFLRSSLQIIADCAKNDRNVTLRARCCEYALLILEHWPDALEIQRSIDLYEDFIRCCVADAMSEPVAFSSGSSLPTSSPPHFSNGSVEFQHQVPNVIEETTPYGESLCVLFSARKVLKQKKHANVPNLGFGELVSPGREVVPIYVLFSR
ncbi:receptor-like protein EIX1 [Pistacia vera]|uniref:receptor-like protein EIX1 n=1 Tax=Pistacia vera TaxID=55513 RepID=UPI0012639A30|nr:receptor-like protein EIX1 [Pistacia vera]